MDIVLMIMKVIGLLLGFMTGVVIIKKYIYEPIFKRIIDIRYYKTVQGLFTFIIQLILYFIIRKYAFGLSLLSEGAGLFLLIGTALGSIMILSSAIILKVLKAYSFEKNEEFFSSSVGNIIIAFVFFLVLAFFEEITVRGILYTGLRNDMGLVVTMIVTTIIFVVPHLKNKGINVFSVVSLILAGVMFNLLREYSGDIWMPFGFHFAWNFFQGITGYNVSGGNEMIAIYKVTAKGKRYLDGGKFGIEASVVTIVIMVISIFSLIIFMYF